MRRYTFASVVAAGGAALALSMVLVNIGFEAVGSVPDIEGCGFLAGSLLTLAILYPLLAAAFGARVARSLLRRDAPRDSIARAGALTGALGSGVYFGAGTLAVLRTSHGLDAAPLLLALSAGFVIAGYWAGKGGATLRRMGGWPRLLRRTGS